ncbi:MAG TPA: exodeoxyribonuclease VII large subunit [Methanoregulaceae archaeon]|nr:exodeoxyribonuclease VII large subunit [Methanoregulaceae archaeon]HQN90073.1 exodeoxyribonuclease VII large subunit [Methanoregulaceae archaeon]
MVYAQKGLPGAAEEHGIAVFSISEISSVISSILDDTRIQDIWIRGEVTNFRPHVSGHRYFSLSERGQNCGAVINCVMWRSDAKRIGGEFRDGMDVIAFGSITHYAPQGKYQFIARELRHAGVGEKHLLVERWKAELAAEGLFSEERKRPLPRFPMRVGVVTSETGAVLQDIRNIIARRFPLEIIVSPTAVQGESAHLEIAAALRRIDGRADVIIVGRGGGSFEDLFPFNHPDVVRALSRCSVPVVSAIGHEVDITLADFAADVRAPTPSAAAELVVQDREVLREGLTLDSRKLGADLIGKLDRASRELSDLRTRIAPGRMQRRIADRQQDAAVMAERLSRALTGKIAIQRLVISGFLEKIENRNPLRLLERGYAIIEKDGRAVKSVQAIKPGTEIQARMKGGKLDLLVRSVTHDKDL